MMESDRPSEKLLASLRERAKELDCLYQVEQILSRPDLPFEEAFQQVVDAIPPGWQYPDVCGAMIEYRDGAFTTDGFRLSDWVLSTDIVVQDRTLGRVLVCYVEERPREDVGPFLKEEQRLIRTIAERLGHFILYQRLRDAREGLRTGAEKESAADQDDWRGPIELLRRSDRDLYLRTARRMVNYLCWAGVEGAQELLQEAYGEEFGEDHPTADANVPVRAPTINDAVLLSGKPFKLAASKLGGDKVLSLVQNWMVEDRASFLPKLLNNPRSTFGEVTEGMRRFHHLVIDGAELSPATANGIRVSLIRRFLTEQLDLITVAKEYINTGDFLDLLDRVIVSSDSHGRLGGKSSELFLAEKILRSETSPETPVGEIKVPRSWYVPSEELTSFLEYNDLEEVLQQKYRDIAQVRHDYPNIVQLFKNSRFPAELERGLSMLLDEVGEVPLIVRSSSLLEDRLGSAFSGKYKSLFLANQGGKHERLAALMDAIAEVYASLFAPDPIAYRREKGLIDYHEKMAILIQQVVGRRVGDYFFPALAGVAFSKNEFRWSPRIQRDDGLIRLVPGLGTRAVDRMSSDYPILVVPGQPNLRVNATIEETIRYSPQQIDVINLKSNRFETLDLKALLVQCKAEFPAFETVFSLLRDETLRPAVAAMVNPERDELVVDFNGLITNTPFVRHVGNMLEILKESLGTPVDIEFAFDGSDFYLLQCRAQSYADEEAPAPIPKDAADEDVVFFADRYVSNGFVPDITHIVYVDALRYDGLEERSDLQAVGRAVGRLNKLLPKRQFILIGPGRWGSRGDIKLGVSVSYSDINNTAALIEVARSTGAHVPDLSFGTHFFQDLVESSIRYLPLYPDETEGGLNERFLCRAQNLLREMLPEFENLSDVLRVIDVPAATQGRVLRVLMNADLDEAIGVIADPSDDRQEQSPQQAEHQPALREEYWRWRMRMAERIAAEIDTERLGVQAMYVIGSTKNASAGPSSDIDLLVHFRGSDAQRRELNTWLEGWSLCLGEVNYLRTGYTTRSLLDVHIITDDDIEKKTSYALKIGAVTDAALELTLGGGPDNKRNS
jgi:predicted nucleotidyltransferase